MTLLHRMADRILRKRSGQSFKTSGDIIAAVREKWREVPSSERGRTFSSDLLKLSDEELLRSWRTHDESTATHEVRGWYREKYREEVRGKDLLDFGCGFSVDGIFFLRHGARVTFADIVEDNLKLVKRVVELLGLKAEFYFIDDFYRFHFEHSFDFIFAIGSLIHVPFEIARDETSALQVFLRDSGKFMFLGYPRERYINLGARDGYEFGRMTDGSRTPWAEWYDDGKIRDLFGNDFRLTHSRNFGRTGTEFNWFELVKQRAI